MRLEGGEGGEEVVEVGGGERGGGVGEKEMSEGE